MDQAVAPSQDPTDRLISALRGDEFILYGQRIARLAPEFVKLGPGLVRMLNQGSAGMDRVDAINRECHALGIKTIAEHVESDQTIARLRGLGVDFGQGFGIRAPQPLA